LQGPLVGGQLRLGKAEERLQPVAQSGLRGELRVAHESELVGDGQQHGVGFHQLDLAVDA
jgi:hypothetical protein